MNSHLDSFLGMQIRVLREQKGWNQTELAERAGMLQPRIALFESMNYSAWSLDVLRRLAEALDLRIVVKFEEFGTYFKEYLEEYDKESLKRRSFEHDIIFNEDERNKALESQKRHSLSTTVQNPPRITARRANSSNLLQGEVLLANNLTASQTAKGNVRNIADYMKPAQKQQAIGLQSVGGQMVA